MINRSRDLFIVITSVFCTLVIAFLVYNFFINTGEIKKFNEVREILKDEYYQELNQDKLVDDALTGMVDSIGDKYTAYLTKQEWDKRKEDFAGEYTGIGIFFNYDSKYRVYVEEILAGSPAEKAGLKVGDILEEYNGTKITKNTDMRELFDSNTTNQSTLKIFRPSTKERFTKTITKEIIVEENATSKVIDGTIGYIKLFQFDDNIAADFKTNYEKLAKKQINRLIIDVRDNPGGSLSQVVEICDFLLPKCTIVSVKGRNSPEEFYYSDEKSISIPITVLINGNSASASEVLASALHDNNKATLVGEKSFGKGLVQNSVEFDDGSAIYYTEARYYTPKGVCIHGIGIQPDVKVSMSKDGKDTQLQAAIKGQ